MKKIVCIRDIELLGVLASMLLCASSIRGQTIEVNRSCSDYRRGGIVSKPKYSIEKRTFFGEKQSTLSLYISMDASSMNELDLGRLACTIQRDFGQQAILEVTIFDDRKAARDILLNYTEQPNHGEYLWHLKGRIHIDRTERRAFFELAVPEIQEGLLGVRRYKFWLTLA